jgi:hypothetical protein
MALVGREMICESEIFLFPSTTRILLRFVTYLLLYELL